MIRGTCFWSVICVAGFLMAQAASASAYQERLPSDDFFSTTVFDYLLDNGYDQNTLASLEVVEVRRDAASAMTEVSMRQVAGGLEVYGAYVYASFDRNGELNDVEAKLASTDRDGIMSSLIGDKDALLKVWEFITGMLSSARVVEVGRSGNTVEFTGSSWFLTNPTVTRVAIPNAQGTLSEGFLVDLQSADGVTHEALVDGVGRILQIDTF